MAFYATQNELFHFMRCLDCEYDEPPATLDNSVSPLCDEIRRHVQLLRFKQLPDHELLRQMQKMYGRGLIVPSDRF